MPKLPGFGPDSRITRWVGRATGGRLAPRGVRIITFGAALVLALGMVAAIMAVQVSSTPTFCGSCHIMKPYYESWKQSGHAGIACVECHIPPGITAEFRKKYEAMAMVARYFTGTYGTNPWTEVDDAACLRCHERRLLEGKEVFQNVLFDHTPHLTESRRGLKLRCTSCHSQIVQGSHIAVTSSTCALCHFKGQPPNKGTGACLTCHEIPDRVVVADGEPFDHSQVGKLDMDCTSCHGNVVRGQGNVPKERCLTCHNQSERLAEYGNKDLLHRMHVSEHKINCMDCHLQIEHGNPPSPVMAAQTGCQSCHGSGHSPQENLYAGIGGRDVPRMPSPMFVAGVTCEGCHNPNFAPATTAAASTGMMGIHTVKASDVSCMSCHGPTYKKIYDGWHRGVASRLGALERQLNATVAAMGVSAPQAWEDARHNFLLVERGHGIHNVNFAYALLEKSYEQMNEARQEKGLAKLPKPWQSVAGGKCLNCHQGVEELSGKFAGLNFRHAPHLLSAKLECETCHRPHAERAPGEVVRFGERGCVTCHHAGRSLDLQTCGRCHGDVTTKTVTSYRGEFSHKAHLEQGLECATCHEDMRDPRPSKAICAQCHGEE